MSCQIQPYPYAYYDNHDPVRPRKLLLHKKELARLFAKIQEDGMSLIPVALYFKNGRAKVEIAVARGKKLWDKRADMKKRDQNREVARAMRRDR